MCCGEPDLDITNALEFELSQRRVLRRTTTTQHTTHPIQSDLEGKLQLGATPFTTAERQASDEDLGQ